jgi:hypothetical protein
MTEEFIHYLWRYQLLKHPLRSLNEENIEIFSIGQRNRDAGPDYLNARIRIGGTLWAGDVEIHVKSSDWNLHGHNNDRAFDGVILHIVYENDCLIERFDNQEIPTLEISDLFEPGLFEKYSVFLSSLGWIPCEGGIRDINPEIWPPWFISLAEERLLRKSQPINNLFIRTQGDLESTFYQCLASSFGQKVNSSSFEWLAQSLELKLIMKHQSDITCLEALCFGQAGFLEGPPQDDYSHKLKDCYLFLRSKHGLENLPLHVWKFLRMRPAGFPTLKIAQWAAFLHHHADKLTHLLQPQAVAELHTCFDVEISEYWWDHYHFNRKASLVNRKIGKDTEMSVIINCIIPFIFIRGVRVGDQAIIGTSIDLLGQLAAEDNTVIRSWRSLGVPCENALASQALLELKNQYCDRKNCLYCPVGNDLLKRQS